MEELNYLTDEFKKILSRSYDIVELHKMKEVPLDVVMLEIIDYYLTEEDELDFEVLNLYLRERIKDSKDQHKFFNELESFMDKEFFSNEEYAYKLPEKYYLHHDLAIMSKDLEDLIYYLDRKKNSMSNLLPSSMNIGLNKMKIDPVLFFGSALEVSTKISEVLKKYDITNETLSDYIKDYYTNKFLDMNLDPKKLFEKALDYSKDNNDKDNKPKPEEDDREFEMAGQGTVDYENVDPNSTTPFLDQYSTNLSKQVKENKFDPVVGRDKEISQVIEILSCRKKSNVVLLGLAGIGKTSIVVGLAQAIESGNVPAELKGKEVCSIDIMGMISGATFRGDAEKRALGVFNELVEHPEIIAFIDEIHQIYGAGSNTPGNGDIASLLKPYLSGTAGKITVVGTSTNEEYRKFIEKDSALKRRFQEVQVEEPTIEETRDILEKVAPKYEEYHKVKYTPEAIEACINWSSTYISDRNHPDKDIDIIDIAGSLTKLRKEADPSTNKINKLEAKIKTLAENKKELIVNSEFEKASKIRHKIKDLESKISEEKSKLDKRLNDSSKWPEVTVDEIASVVSKISKVPVDKIRKTSFDKLRSMKSTMEQKIIGQPDAIRSVSMTLNRQFLGFKDKSKPVSLMFIGKTATGKTYLSKIIANEVFGSEKNLIRIDCSLLASGGEAAGTSLLGSSAGYVGYDSPTIFEEVRKRPFSVVLFDEIEKAPEGIINTILLPLLDEGYITLANNTRVNFSNCIIIFTSNIGTKEVEAKGAGLGFSKLDGELKNKDDESTIMKAIKKKFRPEVINRISEIIFFRSLSEEDLKKIFDLEIIKLKDRLSEKGFTLSVTNSMKNFIVSKCDLNYGARDLQRHIVEYCENSILESMLNFKNIDNCGKNITVDLVDNNPVVNFNTTIVLDNKSSVKQLS